MSWTLASLKTGIQDYLESTETSFVSNLDNFITTTEERILKNVQLDNFRKNVTGNVTVDNTYLATPSDFLSPFSLAASSPSIARTCVCRSPFGLSRYCRHPDFACLSHPDRLPWWLCLLVFLCAL